MNFGNGFYNDHHFHYGYHIYASAVAAHLDPAWGRLHFERVTSILAGDFVSPYPRPSAAAAESEEDSDSGSSASKITESGSFFVPFRQKDWYEGHSWASGIAQPAPLNGRNQESTSEAIAAYEAVGLYGSVMVSLGMSRAIVVVSFLFFCFPPFPFLFRSFLHSHPPPPP